MPTYSYRCAVCGLFEWVHPMDKEFIYCPKCGTPDFNKVFSNVSVSFKGSGFYSTDSKGK